MTLKRKMDNPLFEYLKNSPIFSRLDPYMFQVVENSLHFKQLGPQEVLFTEGEHGDFMAFLLIGELSVIKYSPSGAEIKVGEIRAGESTGEMALLDLLTRSATIKAASLCALVTLSRADFERILSDYPRIGVEMLRGLAIILSLNLRRTSEHLTRAVNA